MATVITHRATIYLFTAIACGLAQCKPETSSLDTEQAQGQVTKEPESCLFKSDIFFSLSLIRRHVEHLPLDSRCKIFYEELKTHLNGDGDSAEHEATLSKPELFQLSIQLLRHKHLAFNNTYKALGYLEECVAKLPEYQMPCSTEPRGTYSQPTKPADLASEHELLQRQSDDQVIEIEKLRGELEAKERRLESLEAESVGAQSLLQDKDAQIKELQWKLQKVRQAAETVEVLLEENKALGRSRLEEMIKLYQQASNRAAKTKDELDEAKRRLAQLEGRKPNQLRY